MTVGIMFIDASAIIAILTFEPEKLSFSERIAAAETRIVSPVVVYETILGLQRKKSSDLEQARRTLDRFLADISVEIMPMDASIGFEALRAHERFGKGRHKAGLNMGDCFAYACAKTRGVPLLFKGDDFVHTDIKIA